MVAGRCAASQSHVTIPGHVPLLTSPRGRRSRLSATKETSVGNPDATPSKPHGFGEPPSRHALTPRGGRAGRHRGGAFARGTPGSVHGALRNARRGLAMLVLLALAASVAAAADA